MTPGAWWERLRRVPPVVGDLGLVAAFVVVAVLEHGADVSYKAGPLWLNVLLTGTVLLLLGFRRAAPVPVLVLSCAVLAVPTAFVHHDFLVWTHLLPLAIEVYTVARQRLLPVATACTALALATVLLDVYVDVDDHGGGWALAFFVLVPALTGGVVMRRNAERRAAIVEALARVRDESETRERLVLLDERASVARDLHDVVAHAVSVMLASAERASAALEHDPDAAEEAVRVLESSGRSATAELRRMLGLLRSSSTEADPGEPAPGLASLDALVTRMREAGLRVTVDERGERPVLPAGFEVSVYRIVQEALTNVLTHAGPVAVDLRLRYDDENEVAVDVVDQGATGAARSAATEGASSGHGLVGMRERVSLLGGDLHVGREATGYAVRVRLPLPAVTS